MRASTMGYAVLGTVLWVGGCVAPTADPDFGDGPTGAGGADGKADASHEAVILEVEFDGELVTDHAWGARAEIDKQLLYTIGHFNGDRSVGRLDRLVLTNIQSETTGSTTRIRYHARMPVAWGERWEVPTTYSLTLPRAVSATALEAFATAYGTSCVDGSAHDVDAGIMWYYFRPRAQGCALAAGDVVELDATLRPSALQTTGKYPEYDQVWEDGALQAVAIFGKYEDGATDAGDAGIASYNRFVRLLRSSLAPLHPTTTPTTVPTNPGVDVPDVELRATLADGRTLRVVALLVDSVRAAGPEFDARYHDLTPTADLIAYNGHSGLGANIRALARKGSWAQGQYTLVYMNGCDTYAYVDSALANAHAAVNPDDPTGTRHLDLAMNAMPSYFSSGARSTMTFIEALLRDDAPKTYEQIFEAIDPAQVIVVSGEEDNVYAPGGPGPSWEGLTSSGAVARGEEHRVETPVLPAGRYSFELAGTADADLYVRVGAAPTTSQWDCRPYESDSSERCDVSLAAPAVVHVMVRGYAAASTFTLVGRAAE